MLARLSGACADTAADAVASAVVCVRWQYGETALMHASREGEVEAMKVLLDKGADVNAATNVSAALAASIARMAVWRVCGHGG